MTEAESITTTAAIMHQLGLRIPALAIALRRRA